ncbi:MAG: ice-binding family protein [Pseudomonadota bacterium]
MNRFPHILSKSQRWLPALAVAVLVAGCGSGADSPAVTPDSTTPGAIGASPVNLGTAGNFAILAKSGISTVPASAVTGDMGVSPIAATAITGFSLTLDSTGTFSTSTQVVGKVYAADYASPTPTNLAAAVLDMQAAYSDIAGRAPNYTEVGAGNLGGMTLAPAIYKWSTGVSIPTDVTLKGGPTDVWIFQIAGGITQASGTRVLLSGGALAKNIFWQSAGVVALNTTAHMEGIVLSKTGITLATGATANGRLLAQTAVTLDTSTVTQPGSSVVTADDTTAPTVGSTVPATGATGVAMDGNITVTFSEPMNATTINATTFTLTTAATLVPSAVTYAGNVATLNPNSSLAANTVYTATITDGALDLSGNALAVTTWSFTTGTAAVASPAPVILGTAGNFAILAKSGISTVPASAVTGNIGVSPIAATAITGFSLTLDSTGTFSTSTQVVGKVYAANYTSPTPANLITAISDMEAAYTDAAARITPDFTELYTGNIGGKTLVPGLYKWGTGVSIPTDVTLKGGPTDVWIFQIAGGITQASGTRVLLSGGALPKNIFWQTAGVVALNTTAHMEGIVLSKTGITLATGATVNGRLLAQTAVTLDTSTVTQP